MAASPISPKNKFSMGSPSVSFKSKLSFDFSESSKSSFNSMKHAKQNEYERKKVSLTKLFESKQSKETDISTLQLKLNKNATHEHIIKSKLISNKYKHKNNIFYRIITLSYFYEPGKKSIKKLIKGAKTGDILLLKSALQLNYGSISDTISNGIRKCANESNFISTQQMIQQYDKVGIVVEIHDVEMMSNLKKVNNFYSEIQGNDVKYVLYSDCNGIKMIELSILLNMNVISHLPCAMRRLHINNKSRRSQCCEKIQQIGLIILKRYNGCFYFNSNNEFLENIELTEVMETVDRVDVAPPSAGAVDLSTSKPLNLNKSISISNPNLMNSTSREGSGIRNNSKALVNAKSIKQNLDASKDHMMFQEFLSVVIERVKYTMMTPSIEDLAEARRAFFLMDSDGSGELQSDEVMQLLATFLSNNATGNAQERKEQEAHLLQYLKSMDVNGDGLISLQEYVEAYKLIEVTVPNSNLEIESVINAEFVACLYVACEVLKPEYVTDDILYMPSSFSTTMFIDSNPLNNTFPVLEKPYVSCSCSKSNSIVPQTDSTHMKRKRYLNTKIENYMLMDARLSREISVTLI